ncbi:sigma D regulator [Pseudomaricurvus alkylphenolicus]|jgi:regulator of sigma D|uniref:sigma D regulator n=1 Tax=Pseudomaricurvus alkylphenolicus TaxID=1306991 RepID=UPI00142154C5|nr:sigma D regulator [Pseudomaricurvus alkylphenolicus]NIB39574.1 sigma D regulator [Pseudomaricurvus alkylphenolicus]
MLENCQSAKERWGGVSEIIDRWLQERQELLVRYCGLSDAPDSSDAAQQLQSVCQILVDYVSAGHFEVYDKLIKEGREFEDETALEEASKLFTAIDQTTEFALDFNDKYLETDDLEALAPDLSKLGEVLAVRFEAEDRMIEVLHIAHKDLVA